MTDWFDDIINSTSMLCGENFFNSFPETDMHFCDDEVNGVDIIFPDFNASTWDGLERQEFECECDCDDIIMAKCIRWVGSDSNKMQLYYADSSNWYFIAKEDSKFFGVGIIGSHPEVYCNNFNFCNSDGSSYRTLILNQYTTAYYTLTKMMLIATNFIENQIH
jgi:hypothetical protein